MPNIEKNKSPSLCRFQRHASFLKHRQNPSHKGMGYLASLKRNKALSEFQKQKSTWYITKDMKWVKITQCRLHLDQLTKHSRTPMIRVIYKDSIIRFTVDNLPTSSFHSFLVTKDHSKKILYRNFLTSIVLDCIHELTITSNRNKKKLNKITW